jgi:hypothetical protein
MPLTVTEARQLVDELTGRVERLKVESKEADLSLRQQIRTLDAMLMLIQISTGDKNIDKAMQKIQQFMALLMRLRMLMLAVEAAEGPWGWAYAGANALTFGISLTDFGMSGTG